MNAMTNSFRNETAVVNARHRAARLAAAQQRISARRLAARVGRRMRVLVDAIDENAAIARSEADAPEIDGVVRIRGAGAGKLPVGEFAEVEITGSSEYDLEARVA